MSAEIERLKLAKLWDHKTQEWVNTPVDVSVDLNAVANQLAARAKRNLSKSATALHGAVKVTIR